MDAIFTLGLIFPVIISWIIKNTIINAEKGICCGRAYTANL